MSDITINEVHTLIRQYLEDLTTENAKLREENKKLRIVAVEYYTALLHNDNVLDQIMARKKLQELEIEVDE